MYQSLPKIFGALSIALIMIVGCESKGCDSQPQVSKVIKHKKKEFGRIYYGSDGHYYVRSHKPGMVTGDNFTFWMFYGGSDYGTNRDFSRGSWTPVSARSLPETLAASSEFVEEEEGKPTQEIEEESAIANDEAIELNTTEAEADSAETGDSSSGGEAGGSSGGESGGASSGGGESGGDSGGDSGGGGDGGSD